MAYWEEGQGKEDIWIQKALCERVVDEIEMRMYRCDCCDKQDEWNGVTMWCYRILMVWLW